MPLHIVRLVDVGLDQRHTVDTRVPANKVENQHTAAARADLKNVRHRIPPAGRDEG